MDKKRKASADLEGSEDIKRQKIDASQEVDPPLTDLPADPLLHLLNFVGARGLLTLATTCSKFKSIVDSRLQSYIKRIFSVGFDELLDPANRAKSVQALKRAAKTEEAFGYRVKVMSLVPAADEKPAPPNWGRQRNPLRTPYQLLKWDDHKLAHISRNYRRCTITCTETGGKMCTVDFENDVTHFASSSMGQIAFVVTTPEGSDKVLVYAFDEYYSPSLIGSFVRNNLSGQLHNIAWTASNNLVLIRSTLYELCTITGESLRTKLFEFNEEGAVHMVVSPDGMFAIRAQYEFSGEPATFYQIDIAAGTEKRVFSIESVADFMEHLQFVGNNPDLLTWYIEGTGQSAIFLYNLKTKKKRMWAVNTGVNDISLDGKKVVVQQDYDYSDMRATCRILETETNKQLGDLLKFPENPKGAEVGQFFMAYYNWTYPITNTSGPSEKLLVTGDDRVNVFDPQTGKHIAEVKYFDVNVFLRLAAVSRDNRTLVFVGDPVMDTNISNAVVWHFH